MNEKFKLKLESLIDRYDEISHLLSAPEIINDQKKFRSLSQEYSQLEEVVQIYSKVKELDQAVLDAKELSDDPESDSEMKELAKEEIKSAQQELEIENKNLSKIEKIKKFIVIKDQFTIENGLVTPTLKLKRYKIIQKHKNHLKNLY